MAVREGDVVHGPGSAHPVEGEKGWFAVVVAPAVQGRHAGGGVHDAPGSPSRPGRSGHEAAVDGAHDGLGEHTRVAVRVEHQLVVDEHPVADLVARHVAEHDGVVAAEPVVEPRQHRVPAVLLDRAAGQEGAQPDLVGQVGPEPFERPVGDSRRDRCRQGMVVHDASLGCPCRDLARGGREVATRSAASARAPSMNVDRRRRSNRHAHDVEAGPPGHAAVVHQPAAVVEHGNVHPREVRPDSRWPRRPTGSRPSAGRSRAAASAAPTRRRSGTLARRRRRTRRCASSSRPSLRSASAQTFAQRAGELRAARRGSPANRPTSADAARLERVQVERARSAPTSCMRRQVPGADEVVHLVAPLVEDAGGVQPPQDVAAPVAAGHPDVLADRER